jgi:hypothetical protein
MQMLRKIDMHRIDCFGSELSYKATIFVIGLFQQMLTALTSSAFWDIVPYNPNIKTDAA